MTDPTRIDTDRLVLHTEWLRALALRLVGDPHLADDVVQEAFLVALQRPFGAQSSEGGARAWLFGILRNVVRTGRRTDGRRRHREHEYREARPVAEPGSDQVVERARRARQLMDAVLALDEPYRTAVLLAYEERLDAPAIAARTGVSPVAARKRISRGVQQLRARLGASGEGRGWLLGLAGTSVPKAVSKTAPTAFWISGLAMTTKLAPALALFALVAGFGIWSLYSGAPSSGSAAQVERSSDADAEAVDLAAAQGAAANTDRSAVLSSEGGSVTAPVRAGVIAGRVLLTDDRTPVIGATVRTSAREGSGGITPPEGEVLSTTDATGHFQFTIEGDREAEPLKSGLWVQHPDVYDVHVPSAEISVAEGHLIEVRTVALGSLKVKVVDSDGVPAPDVQIVYSMKPTFGSDAQLWDHQGPRSGGTSDAFGEVRIEGLPVETLIRVGVRGEWSRPASAVIDPLTRRAETVMELEGWATLTAKLEWPDGTPAANITAVWSGAPHKAGSFDAVRDLSNEEGAVRIDDLSSGEGLVTIVGPAYHAPIHARVERGAFTDLGTLTLQRPVALSGRVIVPKGGLAPPGLCVTALRDGVVVGEQALPETLEFALSVPPGPLTIAVTQGLDLDPRMPFRGDFMGFVAASAPARGVEVPMTAPVAEITGRIEGPSAGLLLQFFPDDGSAARGFPHQISGGSYEPEVDSEGAFAAVVRPIEDARILLREPGGRSAYLGPLSVAPNASIDLGDVVWSRSTLHVNVQDAAGVPLADAVVVARGPNRERSQSRTDERGRATFDLAVGPYGIQAETDGASSGSGALVHVVADRTAEFTLSMDGEGLLTGVVHSPDGPAAGVGISAQCMEPISNLSHAATTAADGTFAFQPVSPGLYRYWISGELVGVVELRPGVPSELNLHVGGAAASVSIVRGAEAVPWVAALTVTALHESDSTFVRGSQTGIGEFDTRLHDGPLQFMLDPNGLGNNQQVVVMGPPAEGATYRLELPSTGIELRLEGPAAHTPRPTAYLTELDGRPARTHWGPRPELYVEDLGMGADGARTLRVPYVNADARVRMEGIGTDGRPRVETVRVEPNGWTRVRWN